MRNPTSLYRQVDRCSILELLLKKWHKAFTVHSIHTTRQTGLSRHL